MFLVSEAFHLKSIVSPTSSDKVADIVPALSDALPQVGPICDMVPFFAILIEFLVDAVVAHDPIMLYRPLLSMVMSWLSLIVACASS